MFVLGKVLYIHAQNTSGDKTKGAFFQPNESQGEQLENIEVPLTNQTSKRKNQRRCNLHLTLVGRSRHHANSCPWTSMLTCLLEFTYFNLNFYFNGWWKGHRSPLRFSDWQTSASKRSVSCSSVLKRTRAFIACGEPCTANILLTLITMCTLQ